MAGKVERHFIELNLAEEGDGFTGVLLNFGDIAEKAGYREQVEASGISVRDGIILNRQHQRTMPIARAGTEHLRLERSAGQISAKLNSWPDSAAAPAARQDLNAGLLEGLSMELRVDEAAWDGDLRTIKRGEIVGMALVDQGAYPSSVINRAWDGFEEETPPPALDPRVWL